MVAPGSHSLTSLKRRCCFSLTANLKNSREDFYWSTKGFTSTCRPADQHCVNGPVETPEACGRGSVFRKLLVGGGGG